MVQALERRPAIKSTRLSLRISQSPRISQSSNSSASNSSASNSSESDSSESNSSESKLDQELVEALDNALTISEQQGLTSSAAAVAWDIVEEIMAAKSRQRTKRDMTRFEQYCLEHPEAPESRIYDV
ncbi:MAG: Calvin cycle protein CP12 [Elainellaceae cyanobacterium]